jgi:hypothetical protein
VYSSDTTGKTSKIATITKNKRLYDVCPIVLEKSVILFMMLYELDEVPGNPDADQYTHICATAELKKDGELIQKYKQFYSRKLDIHIGFQKVGEDSSWCTVVAGKVNDAIDVLFTDASFDEATQLNTTRLFYAQFDLSLNKTVKPTLRKVKGADKGEHHYLISSTVFFGKLFAALYGREGVKEQERIYILYNKTKPGKKIKIKSRFISYVEGAPFYGSIFLSKIAASSGISVTAKDRLFLFYEQFEKLSQVQHGYKRYGNTQFLQELNKRGKIIGDEMEVSGIQEFEPMHSYSGASYTYHSERISNPIQSGSKTLDFVIRNYIYAEFGSTPHTAAVTHQFDQEYSYYRLDVNSCEVKRMKYANKTESVDRLSIPGLFRLEGKPVFIHDCEKILSGGDTEFAAFICLVP